MEETNRLVQIADGVSMPMVGYGTFKPKKGEEQLLHESIVYAVVEGGYRHIDTASLYKNEDIIGEALKEGFDKGVKREDMFITTKIWRTQYYDVEGALRESLSKLQLDYVDLYLVHWMVTDVDMENGIIKGPPLHQVWKDMEALVDKGLTRSIGFSNGGVMMLIEMLAGGSIKPANNQIEINPYMSQTKVVEFFQKFGVSLTAYAPMGSPMRTTNDAVNNDILKEIAVKHNANPGQIALAWCLSRGVSVIPKSVTKERIKANIEAQHIKLDEEDIERINSLNGNKRCFNPEEWFAGFDEWNHNYFK